MTDTIEAKSGNTANMQTISALPPEETERLGTEIVGALKTVFDPEIPADIYELGLIYKVEIKDDRTVDLDMTLTTPNCPAAAELPTMVEAGLPEMEAGAWFAFFAPTGTPAASVAWLNKQANEIFSSPDVQGRFTAGGMTLPLGPPERLRDHVEADTKRWADVIRRAGIKLQ